MHITGSFVVDSIRYPSSKKYIRISADLSEANSRLMELLGMLCSKCI